MSRSAAVVERAEGAPVGIDVPIGLPEEVAPRECDREARSASAAGRVVFNPPRASCWARAAPPKSAAVAERGG